MIDAPPPISPELMATLREHNIRQCAERLYVDNPHLTEWPDDSWSTWTAYFQRVYGPKWATLRMGHGGECDYCAGRIRTEKSDELSRAVAYLAARRRGSCATE